MAHPWVPDPLKVIDTPAVLTIDVKAKQDPVSVAEFKLQSRITGSAEDRLLRLYLSAATELVEHYVRRSLIKQQWIYAIDGEPPSDVVELPRPPLITVESVTTFDLADASSVFDATNYVVDTELSRIFLGTDKLWPSPLRDERSFVVKYTSGYGTAPDDVPARIRLGILKTAAEFYENREVGDDLSDEVKKSLMSFRWQPLRFR